MSFLTLSLLAALAAVVSTGIILGTQIYLRHERNSRFETLQLTPNVLMTRYPLLFVGRPRSLFRLGGDFLELPLYLYEHGYQVDAVEIRKGHNSTAEIQRLIETRSTPVHLIVGETLADAAFDLALGAHPKLSTLTILGHHNRKFDLRPSRRPVFEKPELHPSILASSFQTEEIALKHMVSLAEYDLR
jgi:hypothetical protein